MVWRSKLAQPKDGGRSPPKGKGGKPPLRKWYESDQSECCHTAMRTKNTSTGSKNSAFSASRSSMNRYDLGNDWGSGDKEQWSSEPKKKITKPRYKRQNRKDHRRDHIEDCGDNDYDDTGYKKDVQKLVMPFVMPISPSRRKKPQNQNSTRRSAVDHHSKANVGFDNQIHSDNQNHADEARNQNHADEAHNQNHADEAHNQIHSGGAHNQMQSFEPHNRSHTHSHLSEILPQCDSEFHSVPSRLSSRAHSLSTSAYKKTLQDFQMAIDDLKSQSEMTDDPKKKLKVQKGQTEEYKKGQSQAVSGSGNYPGLETGKSARRNRNKDKNGNNRPVGISSGPSLEYLQKEVEVSEGTVKTGERKFEGKSEETVRSQSGSVDDLGKKLEKRKKGQFQASETIGKYKSGETQWHEKTLKPESISAKTIEELRKKEKTNKEPADLKKKTNSREIETREGQHQNLQRIVEELQQTAEEHDESQRKQQQSCFEDLKSEKMKRETQVQNRLEGATSRLEAATSTNRRLVVEKGAAKSLAAKKDAAVHEDRLIIQDLQKQIKDLQRQREVQDATIDDLQKKIENLHEQRKVQDAVYQQNELECYRWIIDELEKKHRETIDELKQKRREKHESQLAREDLQTIARLEKGHRKTIGELEAARVESERKHRKTIEKAEEKRKMRMEDLQKQVEDLHAKLKIQKENVEWHRCEQSKLERKYHDRLQKVRADSDARVMQATKTVITEYEERRAKYDERLTSEYEARLRKIEVECERRTVQASDATERFQSSREECQRKTGELEDLQIKIEGLQRKVEGLQKKCDQNAGINAIKMNANEIEKDDKISDHNVGAECDDKITDHVRDIATQLNNLEKDDRIAEVERLVAYAIKMKHQELASVDQLKQKEIANLDELILVTEVEQRDKKVKELEEQIKELKRDMRRLLSDNEKDELLEKLLYANDKLRERLSEFTNSKDDVSGFITSNDGGVVDRNEIMAGGDGISRISPVGGIQRTLSLGSIGGDTQWHSIGRDMQSPSNPSSPGHSCKSLPWDWRSPEVSPPKTDDMNVPNSVVQSSVDTIED